MANQAVDKRNNAILGLILNILVLPGVGTIVGGKTDTGVLQIALFCGSIFMGIIFTITIIGAIIGIPLMIFGPLAAWVWGLITGIKMVQEQSL